MKIGLFFGSFNPIHIGHLIIASFFYEKEGFDFVWFVLTPQNPHKDLNTPDFDTRKKFIEASIRGDSRFQLCEIEKKLPPPNYTINTLEKLTIDYPKFLFSLIIGEDNAYRFHLWEKSETILKNFPVLVYPRNINPTENKSLSSKFTLMKDAPIIEVSSTKIREMIRQKQNIKYYVSHNVEQLISNKKHYL